MPERPIRPAPDFEVSSPGAGPAQARAAVLLFWDYDTQWGGDRSRSGGGPKSWGALEFENTDRLLDIHREYGLPACFAVVGEAGRPGRRPYHDPVQLRRIHEAGHEIGSHSLRHDWLPGLSPAELARTVAESKEILEQCVGDQVVTFVPPYNQPFDYPAGLSISLSERREARGRRSGLVAVCRALVAAGYRFCRVAYRPIPQRLAERVAGRRLDRPSRLESIAGISCVRLNTAGGFAQGTQALVERCAERGGIAVVYGHPHSLGAENAQNERFLRPFLERVAAMRREGRLEVLRPKDLLRVAER
jgi:peptidoglycan/xylan/chitin deacetylase (PgdA/CDA1 family)